MRTAKAVLFLKGKKNMELFILCLIFLIYMPLHYLFFRMTVAASLRAGKMSHTAIKKVMKGKRNFWFYEELHRTHGLGNMYWLNKWFLSLFPAALILHLALGWMEQLTIFTALLTCVVLLLAAGMWAASQNLPRAKNAVKNEAVFGIGFPLLMCLAVVKGIILALG